MTALAVFIAMQFVQPSRNKSEQVLSIDVSKIYSIPDNVNTMLQNACYDCHSNNTTYPWYSNVQPVGWFIARDIDSGKVKMNFSEWGTLSKRKQISRLQEMQNIIKEGRMPLRSYKLLHKNAQLTEENKKSLFNWIEKTKDSLANS